MNAIQSLAMQPWVSRLGMTLLHFLWQGAIVAAIYAAARRWGVRALDANGRYLLACSALTAMAIAPAVTWILLRGLSPESVAVSFAEPVSSAQIEPARSIALSLPVYSDTTAPGPFFPWVVTFWLTGATAFSLRMLAGGIFAQRLRSRMVRSAPAEWQVALDRLKARICVSRPVRLLVSARVQAPATIGWLRPIVLVPVGALAGMPAAQMEALLLHELAHIRRHDYLIHILQSAVEAVFFYHPAVWWISGHMRAERELCCDDMAVTATGDAVIYARALAEFDSARWAQPTVMAANGGSLADRIGRLLGRPSISRASCGPGTAATLIVLAIGTCIVFAQSNVRSPITQAPRLPAFDAVSVKPFVPTGPWRRIPQVNPTRLYIEGCSPEEMIIFAYGINRNQIQNLPDWAQRQYFQVVGVTDKLTTRDQMLLMLRRVLAERFQFAFTETDAMQPVDALVVSPKGLKMKPSTSDSDCGNGVISFDRVKAAKLPPNVMVGFAGCTVAELVKSFNSVRSVEGGSPVIDKTGLTGKYSMLLWQRRDGCQITPGGGQHCDDVETMEEAVKRLLGLELVKTNARYRLLHATKIAPPSAN